MSYCRFSSNDFQCDVYVYADVEGGYTTHIARTRIVFAEPLPPPIQFDQHRIREWLERDRIVARLVDAGQRQPLALPHAGGTFRDASPGECADRLESLRAEGYRVPSSAIEALREEARAEAEAPPRTRHEYVARA